MGLVETRREVEEYLTNLVHRMYELERDGDISVVETIDELGLNMNDKLILKLSHNRTIQRYMREFTSVKAIKYESISYPLLISFLVLDCLVKEYKPRKYKGMEVANRASYMRIHDKYQGVVYSILHREHFHVRSVVCSNRPKFINNDNYSLIDKVKRVLKDFKTTEL